MLLLHWLRHDRAETSCKFCLASGYLDGSLYRGFLTHGPQDTQPPLCLQQPLLLGAQQHQLYIQGMTYGERLTKAKEHGGFPTDKALARALSDLLRSEGIEKEVPEQTVQKARNGDAVGSKYSSRFARLCNVDLEWLEHGRGDMIKKPNLANSNWPFEFDELRYLRLKPTDKRKIERLVVTLVEDFEADAGARPKKAKRKHK